MVRDFQEIMLTNKNLERIKGLVKTTERKSFRSLTKKENLTPEINPNEPDRVAFIFVIDSNAPEKNYRDVYKDFFF
jgi:hypothetical protein